MLLKVLLVDDEEIIKSGLRETVDWARCGCLTPMEASDGREALDLIRRETPHIVISDIRMPYKNGLELMEESLAEFPNLFFLFISGHDEFSYVQKALKLGASDYILKPIDPLYLENQLIKLSEEIVKRNENVESRRSVRRAMVRQFLQRIILQGEVDREKVWKEADAVDSQLLKSSFRLISFQMDHFYSLTEDQEYLNRSFYSLIDAFDEENRYRISGTIREFDLCLMADSEEKLSRLLDEGIQKIENLRKDLTYTVTLAVSETIIHPDKLAPALVENYRALEMKFLKGGGRTFFPEDYRRFHHIETGAKSLIDSELLLFFLKEGNREEMKKVLKVISGSLDRVKDPRNALKLFATEVLLEILKIMKERELSLEEVMDDPTEEWGKLNLCQTAEEFFRLMEELLISVGTYLTVRKDFHSSQIMDQAVAYIHEHFAESSLSLERVAGISCMSSCYFSVVFKEETGSTFNRYLTNYRINKAKDMILYTSLKSYEIGPKVGYENPSYFSTVFKKATGMSVSEYRKNFS